MKVAHSRLCAVEQVNSPSSPSCQAEKDASSPSEILQFRHVPSQPAQEADTSHLKPRSGPLAGSLPFAELNPTWNSSPREAGTGQYQPQVVQPEACSFHNAGFLSLSLPLIYGKGGHFPLSHINFSMGFYFSLKKKNNWILSACSQRLPSGFAACPMQDAQAGWPARIRRSTPAWLRPWVLGLSGVKRAW